MKKKTFLILFLSSLFLISFSQTNPKVKFQNGYVKKDGVYVKSHYKTQSNYTNRDNFTTKPNANPYTGKKGYISPDNKRKKRKY